MSVQPLDSFVFYRSFRDAISEMTDENKLATLLAICDYALYGVEPKLKDAMARAVFTVARPSIDANKARRDNGKKGGRPKKPMVSDSENLWFSKNESTETETESESVSESGAKGADKPPTPTRNTFGEYGWIKLTDAEHSKLLTDLGQAEFDRCVAYIDESAQTSGNKNKWRDWNLVLRRCAREGWGRRQAEQKGGTDDDYWTRQ